MNILKRALLVSVIAGASLGVNAEVIKTDFSILGDNLVSTDLETGIEWLSLTENANASITNVEALLSSTYAGWRLPTRNEVNVMFSHLTGYDFVGNATHTFGGYNYSTKPSAYNVFDKLGALNANYTRGLYRDTDGTVMMSGAYIKNSSNTLNYMFDDHTSPTYTDDFAAVDHSVFLVSDGGSTISSINNPDLNINNINNSVEDVSLSTAGFFLALGVFGFRRRRD